MDTQSVKKIQDTLVQLGYMTQDEVNTGYGIYGPKTTAAMNKYVANGGKPLNAPTPAAPATKKTITQADIDKLNAEIKVETNNNPITKALVAKGNTPEDLLYATTTGDLSKLTDFTGQPFSLQDQQDAMVQAEKDLEGFYKSQKEKDVADTEAALADKQRAYQESLVNAGEQFSADKTKLDQNAADQGVLFSGSRAQKEQSLKTAYERDAASKAATAASSMGSTARDFQYKYGNDAASSLSDYYNLGSNVYNPKVATGGVTSGGLSSIYNPGQYNFQGTDLAEKKTAAAKRAAGILANKGNKLLATGYSNQL